MTSFNFKEKPRFNVFTFGKQVGRVGELEKERGRHRCRKTRIGELWNKKGREGAKGDGEVVTERR